MSKIVKRLVFVLSAVLFGFLLVFLLMLVERGAEGATITDYPAALWYVLTTLTTVGYGDVYPVTATGRVIGALFQLLSLGFLVFLLSILFSAFKEKILPRLRLFAARRKEWYIFSAATPEALALQKNLRKEQPKGQIIFASSEEDQNLPGLAVPFTPAELVTRHKGHGKDYVFFIGKDALENEREAQALSGSPCRIYCMTDHDPEHLPLSVTLFDPDVCLARLYWQKHPLTDPEDRIVLIGEGAQAENLLLQGLLQNVIAPESAVRYEVFGDFADFRRNHTVLQGDGPVRLKDGSRDAVTFHQEAWNEDAPLLGSAGRIILCFPTDRETADHATKLKRFFPVSGPVHARLSGSLEGVGVFGSLEEIFTPELVMRTALDSTARTLNDIYRKDSGTGAPWEELPAFIRWSNLASADHLSVKLRVLLPDEEEGFSPEKCARAYSRFENADDSLREQCRRIEHIRWTRFHLLNNWSYAPVRNDQKRQHPMILPFEELSLEEQAKDDYAWELLRTLSQ